MKKETKKYLKEVLFISILGFGLSSCASIPQSPIQETTSSDFVDTKFLYAQDNGLEVTPDWWTNFDDPLLVKLVEAALAENRDIETARANLEEADLIIRSAKLGKSYSTVSTSGADFGRSTGSSADFDYTLSGSLAASWELDAFGRIDAEIKAAEFNRESVLQTRRDVAVLVAAETAQAYVDLRGAQEGLAVAQQNSTIQADTLSLVQDLVDNGRSSDLDLHRSKALYSTTLASLPTFNASIQTATAQLAALTGETTEYIALNFAGQDLQYDIPQHSNGLVSGSPKSLITRRPDIRQAQAEISRQLSLSDVERSRLYPTISFNADVNSIFNGTSLINQFSNFGFGFGPNISWEGPDLRSVRVDIDISDAQTKAAISQYEQTILDAIADVEIALTRYGREVERSSELMKASQSASHALELAQLRFDEGFDDFLDVLDAQRTLLEAEEALVQNEILITTYAIAAYSALGGMWTDEELESNRIDI